MRDNEGAVFDTGAATKFIDERRENTKSDLIVITHDKLENILLKHLEKMKSRTAWVAPISIFATLIATLQTVTFKTVFNKSPEFWESFFYFCTFATLIWLLVSLVKLVKHWNDSSLDYLIDTIKDIKD